MLFVRQGELASERGAKRGGGRGAREVRSARGAVEARAELRRRGGRRFYRLIASEHLEPKCCEGTEWGDCRAVTPRHAVGG